MVDPARQIARPRPEAAVIAIDIATIATVRAAGISSEQIPGHHGAGLPGAGSSSAIARYGARNLPRRNSHSFLTPDQCDISTGTVIVSNMASVTPPRIRSCNREWPYPPITRRPILLSDAIDRMAA